MNVSPPKPEKPLAKTVASTCKITGLGATVVYRLISEGKLKAVKIGRRRLILYSSIEDLLQVA